MSGNKQELSNVQKIINTTKSSQTATLQEELSRMLEESNNTLNSVLDLINFILTTIVIVVYIVSTYELNWRSTSWGIINALIHVYFLLEFSVRTYGAKDFTKYLLSMESIVDILSIFSFFILRVMTGDYWYIGEKNIMNELANLICVLRMQRYKRLANYMESDVNKQLLEISLSVVALVLLSAASIQFV